MKTYKPNKCRKCGCKDIKIDDCGYSSFNVGWAQCTECGHKLKWNNMGCFPYDDIVRLWNKDKKPKPSKAEKDKETIKRLRKALRFAKKSLTEEVLNRIDEIMKGK